MATTIKLKSKCNAKGAEGLPGEIITVKDDELAKRIIAGRGGTEVIEEQKQAEPKKA